jgi:hypothetical protein
MMQPENSGVVLSAPDVPVVHRTLVSAFVSVRIKTTGVEP